MEASAGLTWKCIAFESLAAFTAICMAAVLVVALVM